MKIAKSLQYKRIEAAIQSTNLDRHAFYLGALRGGRNLFILAIDPNDPDGVLECLSRMIGWIVYEEETTYHRLVPARRLAAVSGCLLVVARLGPCIGNGLLIHLSAWNVMGQLVFWAPCLVGRNTRRDPK